MQWAVSGVLFILHRATDIYGDVPYTEAGLGYTNSTFKPKYDKQSDIYPKMLSELEAAIKATGATNSFIRVHPISSKGEMLPNGKTVGIP
jgi:hypothetical protein